MSKQCEINQSLVKSTESTFEIFGKKSRKMEDFFFHFFKKLVTSGYLKTGYLTGYLRVEVTRGHQKKKNMLKKTPPYFPRSGKIFRHFYKEKSMT